jgi:hypothetical protein
MKVNAFHFRIINCQRRHVGGGLRVITSHTAPSVLYHFIFCLRLFKIVNVNFSEFKSKCVKCTVCSNATVASREPPLLVTEYFWHVFNKIVVFPRSEVSTPVEDNVMRTDLNVEGAEL